jgi:hypothetical protein
VDSGDGHITCHCPTTSTRFLKKRNTP